MLGKRKLEYENNNAFKPPKKKRKFEEFFKKIENNNKYLVLNGVGDYSILYLLIYSDTNKKFLEFLKNHTSSYSEIKIKDIVVELINSLKILNENDVLGVKIDYTDYSSLYYYLYGKYGEKKLNDFKYEDFDENDKKLIEIMENKICDYDFTDKMEKNFKEIVENKI